MSSEASNPSSQPGGSTLAPLSLPHRWHLVLLHFNIRSHFPMNPPQRALHTRCSFVPPVLLLVSRLCLSPSPVCVPSRAPPASSSALQRRPLRPVSADTPCWMGPTFKTTVPCPALLQASPICPFTPYMGPSCIVSWVCCNTSPLTGCLDTQRCILSLFEARSPKLMLPLGAREALPASPGFWGLLVSVACGHIPPVATPRCPCLSSF